MTQARLPGRILPTAWLLRLSTRYLPFADAATAELPLGRLLRLALFQVSVGISATLLIGTLNRVMIVELGVPAWLVAVMLALPLLAAPFRAVIGFRSDVHRSVFGWRRVPYIWNGTIMQFGGLAIMPFALLDLSGDMVGPRWIGDAGAALAFLLLGAGLHTVQTAGLALAADLAPPKALPKVVGLLGVMMLAGIVASALVIGAVLRPFTEIKLIQVLQGAAVVTLALNIACMWQQEPRDRTRATRAGDTPDFRGAWRALTTGAGAKRRFVAIGLGTTAFSMQDVLLEPYGGQVLHLPVATTTGLTALLGLGGIAGFALAARALARAADPYLLAASGVLTGILAFACVIFAAPLGSGLLFATGVSLIGLGGGLFAAGTLLSIMALADGNNAGLALGCWGAVQASAAGLAVAAGGLMKDFVGRLALAGDFGPGMEGSAAGYGVVYHTEILLLFATLAALGPLVRRRQNISTLQPAAGLARPAT